MYRISFVFVQIAAAVTLAFAVPCSCIAQPAQGRPRPQQAQARPQPPSDVEVVRDVTYLTVDGRALRLNIARPKTPPADPMPVIVFIHGGAWRSGNADPSRNYPLAQRGYFTASIEYRLSQEALFPAQIHDCKAAIRWIRKYARELNVDPNRIGVWGSSAGGHLVALLGTSIGVQALEGPGNEGFSSAVQCVVDMFGPSDLPALLGKPSNIDRTRPDCPEAQLIGGLIADNLEKARAASPVTYVDGNEPPFLILHGTEDPTVPFNQSEILDEALRKVGADVTFVPVKGAGHGFFGPTIQPGTAEIDKMIAEFFDRHLSRR
ncbi:MAG: alpha/beta hydrolase [Armatimonadetes bacterium]|nr:alpha/beta hydrolase [Armatimonadota bacterium]